MSYNVRTIQTEAVQIKEYIEQNKRIPKACKLSNGVVLSPYSVSYLMAKFVQDNFRKSEESLVGVRIYDAGKFADTISENVLKDDYLVMVNNFINFCNKNHRVPAYITTQKSRTQVSFELFMYCLSKIIVFYQKNKYLPNYCNFTKGFKSNNATNTETNKKSTSKSTSNSKKTSTCSNPYTSKPHLADSNLGQDTPYGCGNNAEQQALYKLTGKIFKESELASLSATTTSGTDHNGINTCIAAISKKTGIKLTVKWVYFSDLGKTIEERFEALGKIICQPNKDVITHIKYINGGEDEATSTNKGFGHYESISQIDVKRKTVKVLNSLGTKRANGSYTGRIQERSFKVEASYLAHTPGGQKAICIITKG